MAFSNQIFQTLGLRDELEQELRQKLLNLEENFRKKSEELEGAERSLAKPWPWRLGVWSRKMVIFVGRFSLDLCKVGGPLQSI